MWIGDIHHHRAHTSFLHCAHGDACTAEFARRVHFLAHPTQASVADITDAIAVYCTSVPTAELAQLGVTTTAAESDVWMLQRGLQRVRLTSWQRDQRGGLCTHGKKRLVMPCVDVFDLSGGEEEEGGEGGLEPLSVGTFEVVMPAHVDPMLRSRRVPISNEHAPTRTHTHSRAVCEDLRVSVHTHMHNAHASTKSHTHDANMPRP